MRVKSFNEKFKTQNSAIFIKKYLQHRDLRIKWEKTKNTYLTKDNKKKAKNSVPVISIR